MAGTVKKGKCHGTTRLSQFYEVKQWRGILNKSHIGTIGKVYT